MPHDARDLCKAIIDRHQLCSLTGVNLYTTLPPPRDVISCPHCRLTQYPTANNRCPRCRHRLGVSYLEINLPKAIADSGEAQSEVIRTFLAGVLREMRMRRGLTQFELARSLKIGSRSQLSRYECGRVMPPLRTLLLIATKLGVDRIVLRIRDPSP
jgi:DNA-binding XRE family transcriptional regulator